jgi:hypothetical protein
MPVIFLDTFINQAIDAYGYAWYFQIGCLLTLIGKHYNFFNKVKI